MMATTIANSYELGPWARPSSLPNKLPKVTMKIPFARLNNDQLRQMECKLYHIWWRHSNKTAMATLFGTVQGIATAGVTAPISGAAAVYHTKKAYDAEKYRRLCTDELIRRGLQPLGRGVLGMMWTSASAATAGTVFFLLPGSEIVEIVTEAGNELTAILTEVGVDMAVGDTAEELIQSTGQGNVSSLTNTILFLSIVLLLLAWFLAPRPSSYAW